MVDIEVRKRLSDILTSIEAINGFFNRCPRRFDVFKGDDMFRAAVLYHIAVIGEAVGQILKVNKEIEITSARRIVSTRNYIIHGYDSLDDEILWGIVIRHIPILEDEVRQLLEKE